MEAVNNLFELKKDLPTFAKGTQCVIDTNGHMRRQTDGVLIYPYEMLHHMPNFTEWFEPIDLPNGRTQVGKSYYKFNSRMQVVNAPENGGQKAHQCFEVGNYFKTHKQAATVANAARMLLKVVHTPGDGQAMFELVQTIITAQESLNETK